MSMTASQHNVQPSPIVGSPSTIRFPQSSNQSRFLTLHDFYGFKLDSLLRSPDNQLWDSNETETVILLYPIVSVLRILHGFQKFHKQLTKNTYPDILNIIDVMSYYLKNIIKHIQKYLTIVTKRLNYNQIKRCRLQLNLRQAVTIALS